ncbi:MAG: hypothetical protein ACKVOM_06175 [Ferruginibacter sp.]
MNFKKYLPFENYIITSKLSVEEVAKRLAESIEPKKNLRLFVFNRGSNKPYKGQILGDTFTISRIINYKNSFLPVIRGHISTFLGNTQINVKMRPVTFVLILISLWLGIVGLVCLGIILVGLIQFKQVLQNGFSPMILIPFGMFLFGCLLTTLPFKAESKKSKEFLDRLFEGQENL